MKLLRLRARVKVDEVVGVLIAKYDVSTLTTKFVLWDVQVEDGTILKMVNESKITDFPKAKDEQESDSVQTEEVLENV